MTVKLTRFFILSLFFYQATYAKDAFDIESATIDSVHGALHKNLSCEKLVKAYLERIEKYNLGPKKEASLNAFTSFNPHLIQEAKALDAYYHKNKKFIGPLHCIPVAIKDNIDTLNMDTTAGSLALVGTRPTQDAFLVKKLKEAGALIIGKTGMDEFAWGMKGLSSLSGRIGNVYDPKLNPGGSSSGSAVAVGANFALVGIGTDNSGSVRVPAAFNGLIGLRPSTGLVSQSGIFPMGNLDGVAGPITKNMRDLALILDVIAVEDPHDPKTQLKNRPSHFSNYLNKSGLQKKRIGIVKRVGDFDTFKNITPETEAALEQTYQTLQKQGATIIPDIVLDEFNNSRSGNQSGEIDDINHYFQVTPGPIRNFKELCHSKKTRTFGTTQDCLKFMKSVPAKNSTPYKGVLSVFKRNKDYVEALMDKQQLDALLIPITPHGTPTYDEKLVNTWQAPVSSNAGLPAIALIAGFHPKNKLPIGFELIARQLDEPRLIEMAYAYAVRPPK